MTKQRIMEEAYKAASKLTDRELKMFIIEARRNAQPGTALVCLPAESVYEDRHGLTALYELWEEIEMYSGDLALV